MVCEKNETDLDIGIPAIMLPQDAGQSLIDNIMNSSIGNSSFPIHPTPQAKEKARGDLIFPTLVCILLQFCLMVFDMDSIFMAWMHACTNLPCV